MSGANIKISENQDSADSRRMSISGPPKAVRTAHQLITARYETTWCGTAYQAADYLVNIHTPSGVIVTMRKCLLLTILAKTKTKWYLFCDRIIWIFVDNENRPKERSNSLSPHLRRPVKILLVP